MSGHTDGVRVVAIDWSGAARGARQAIWRAVVRDGSLVELANGLNRDEVIAWLIDQVKEEPNLVAGLDFAFSFPEWFCREHNATDGSAVWRLAAQQGEHWLAECPEPFWGLPGFRRPDLGARSHFRRTEQEIRDAGHGLPKSVFQIGGAGAVGTGSIRGMPHLTRLRDAGFSIWPFTDLGKPLIVEIYPRVLIGAALANTANARRGYLLPHQPRFDEGLLALAVASRDAFDAAVSALVMSSHVDGMASLPSLDTVEGWIWRRTIRFTE